MAHIFISYSTADIAFAEHLQKLLEGVGFHVWRDARGIEPSDDWWETIVENIDSCAAFVVIMSPDSEKSDWVKREILRGERKEKLEKRRIIFPVLLRGEIWSRLAERQSTDMTAGLQASLPDHLRLALYAAIHNTPQAPPVSPISPAHQPNQNPLVAWLSSPTWQGIGVILAVIALLVTIYFAVNPPNSPSTDTPTSQVVVGDPTETSTDTHQPPTETATNTSVPPTGTDTPQPATETLTATLSPTDTPQPSSTPTNTPAPPTNTPILSTPTASPTGGNTIMLTIFRDQDSLTLYVPETNKQLSLVGLAFQVEIAGQNRQFPLIEYSSFGGNSILGNVSVLNSAACFRLIRNGSRSPAPLECQNGAMPLIQNVADADVFWYDSTANQNRTMLVLQDESTIAVCAAGQTGCDVELSLATNAQTVNVVSSATATPGYPCEGIIINPDSGATVFSISVYQDIVGGAQIQTSFRDEQSVTLQRDTLDNSSQIWYLVYNGNQRVGWVLARYMLLTNTCFT